MCLHGVILTNGPNPVLTKEFRFVGDDDDDFEDCIDGTDDDGGDENDDDNADSDDGDGGDGVVGCKEWSEEDGRTRLRPFADPPLAINLTG